MSRPPRSRVFRMFRALALVILGLLALPYLLTPLYHLFNPVPALTIWRKMNGARVERIWIPLTAIAPVLPRPVCVAEDGRFCVHRGIDFGELRAAIEDADDLSEMRGGSPTAQQVATNLFPWPGRSVV